jgi:hypothetical protein
VTEAEAVEALPDLLRYAPMVGRELEPILGRATYPAIITCLRRRTLRLEGTPRGTGYRGTTVDIRGAG